MSRDPQKVANESGDPRGDPRVGPERVTRPKGKFGPVRGTLGEVRNRSQVLRGSPGWVKRYLGWTRTGQGTIRVVRDRSGDPPGDLGRVGGPSGRLWTSGGTSGRYGTGRGTLG